MTEAQYAMPHEPTEGRRRGGAMLSGDLMCDVDGCERLTGFASEQALAAHKRHVHGIEGSGPQRTPESRREARAAARAAYPQPETSGPVPCDDASCDRHFQNRAGMRSHYVRSHNQETSDNVTTITEHEPTTTGVWPFVEDREDNGASIEVVERLVEREEPEAFEIPLAVDADEYDVLCAAAFIEGCDSPAEYVRQMVTDAITAAREDRDITILRGLRDRRRR